MNYYWDKINGILNAMPHKVTSDPENSKKDLLSSKMVKIPVQNARTHYQLLNFVINLSPLYFQKQGEI